MFNVQNARVNFCERNTFYLTFDLYEADENESKEFTLLKGRNLNTSSDSFNYFIGLF